MNKPTNIFLKVIFWIMAIVIAIILVGLLTSGYSGRVSPTVLPWGGVWAMTYGLWAVALALACLLALCLPGARRLAWALPAGIILTIGAFTDFCPLNFFHSSRVAADQEKDVISIMTYNVYHYFDFSGTYPGEINPTISFIISQDTDIVLTQESLKEYIMHGKHDEKRGYKYTKLTAEQVDTLLSKYPYYHFAENAGKGLGNTLFSKYPFEVLPLDYPHKTDDPDVYLDPSFASSYRIAVAPGDTLTLYVVHFNSVGVTDTSATLYKEIKSGGADSIPLMHVGKFYYHRLVRSYQAHVEQARWLRGQIERFGGQRILLAGDFNDISGCYPMRILFGKGDRCRLRQTWNEVGLGPMYTFHAYSLYFHIDHILYGGAIKPLSMHCVKVPYSDHYPVIARYLLEQTTTEQ